MEKSQMISSLLMGPIVLGHDPPEESPAPAPPVQELTPGKENSLIGVGVKLMTLNSPCPPSSPLSSRVAPSFKRTKPDQEALTPVNAKRGRQSFSFNDVMERPRPRQISCTVPPGPTLSGHLSEDEGGVGSSEDEQSPVVPRFGTRPFSHWNQSAAPISPMALDNNSQKFFLQRSQSESAVSVMQAMDMSRDDPLLIGDCSKRFILPFLEKGKHTDLKEISGQTLVSLLDGNFKNCVRSFEIIDCRYPYEYDGGHIRGAVNLYTDVQVFDKFIEGKASLPLGSFTKERHVTIFHCEFSAERGPRMCRHLRDWDRNCNMASFPALHYPEMYVLHGGYKSFYETHKEYCDPPTYIPMSDEAYGEQFKLYRNKSKSELVKTKAAKTSSFKITRQFSLRKLCI